MISKLIPVIKKAGKILLKYHQSSFKVKYKGKNDPVTQADLEVNEFLIKNLKKMFPKDQIFTEETPKKVDFSKRVWIVDPLDGTKAFIKGLDGFSIIIGLCDNGVPVLGIVYIPKRKQLFYAKKGCGAFLLCEKNVKKRISVSKKNKLSNVYLTTFNNDYVKKMSKDRLIKLTVNSENDSAGSRFMRVATGEIDAYLEFSGRSHKWDLCGPQIIIEEAGGRVTSRLGKKLNYKQKSTKWLRNVVSSNSKVHGEIIKTFSQ